MEERKQIPYADWINYVRAAREKGRESSEFRELCFLTPIIRGNEYDTYIQNEIAKLEVELIRSMIEDFQKSVNLCMEEHDLYFFEKGLRNFKKAFYDCLFFDAITSVSENVRNSVKKGIWDNLSIFLDEFSIYVRKLSEYESDMYVNEFLYVYKKSKISKFVQEQLIYE